EALDRAGPVPIPGLPLIGRAPGEARPATPVEIDAEQERAVGTLQDVATGVVARPQLDTLRRDAHRLPGPAPVGGTVQEAAGVTVRVPHVAREQMSRQEDSAVLEDAQIGLPAEQLEALRLRPGLAPVAGAEQQVLLQDLSAALRVLMERGDEEL